MQGLGVPVDHIWQTGSTAREPGASVQGNSFVDVDALPNLYWEQELELSPVTDPPES